MRDNVCEETRFTIPQQQIPQYADSQCVCAAFSDAWKDRAFGLGCSKFLFGRVLYPIRCAHLIEKHSGTLVLNNNHNSKDPSPIAPPDQDDADGNTQLLVRDRVSTERPKMFKVLMLNDDYTPMEFVCKVLQQFFGKSEGAAQAIMLQVHNTGVGVCGVYTFEIAETKATQVMDFARKHEHPLQCTVEAD